MKNITNIEWLSKEIKEKSEYLQENDLCLESTLELSEEIYRLKSIKKELENSINISKIWQEIKSKIEFDTQKRFSEYAGTYELGVLLLKETIFIEGEDDIYETIKEALENE